ncbi:MAG: hypothetical protein ACOC6C_05620 [Verrucomicrobiota bacterium]
MKALKWQRFFQEQRDRHGKALFTPTELANADGCSADSIRVALQRLVAQGIIQRYTDGRYGLPDAVRVEDLVPSLDSVAYITGMYALYRRRLVTQRPSEALCFTRRRHNRSRVRATPLGRIVFVCVSGRVYEHPGSPAIAGPEQSFCDFVYMCRRQHLPPDALATFRNLDSLDSERLNAHLSRYPATVRVVATRLAGLEK